ncbi:hypothetical protein [Hymenobacter armeniacus]|uniref:Uncharacterized protein n=1 Tax=Hymenobacter armeniacus TaxID=2771358 RepID=A0ABR8JXL9_9BACT|nr:hypothetical protein [Hymenobacter armeniacus]MBD2722684.1 hypothetical protein [Hymenobacter armeniacus]
MPRISYLTRRCSWVLLGLLARPGARAQSAAALRLEIVPTNYASTASPRSAIACGHFHVLLTNASAGPVALFEESNGWGYYGLSFDLTYPAG